VSLARHLLRALVVHVGMVLAVALALGLLVEAVEGADRGLAWVLWRQVQLARDLWPALLGLGSALAVARLRSRGELVGLEAAGVPRGRVLGWLAAGCLGLGLLVGGGVEALAGEAGQALVQLRSGQAQVAGRWVQDERLVHLGEEVVTEVLLDEQGRLVGRNTWTDEGSAGLRLDPLRVAAAGPPPVLEAAWFVAPSERGLSGLDGPWLRHRGSLPLLGGLLAFGLAALSLGVRLRPAWSALAAGLVGVSWGLVALLVADSAMAGWLPAGLASVLVGLGLARAR
jgi:hypothetical protein